MKNIIELAARYFDKIDNADGIEELEYKAEESKMKLQEALSEYKRLSETLITEDWLKEHGWKCWSVTGYGVRYYNKHYPHVTIFLSGHDEGNIVEITDGELNTIRLSDISIAQLYDACELCGITMED